VLPAGIRGRKLLRGGDKERVRLRGAHHENGRTLSRGRPAATGIRCGEGEGPCTVASRKTE